LYQFLASLPRILTENMTCLSVAGPPNCPNDDPTGNVHGVNIVAGGEQIINDPWPSDLPQPHATIDSFMEVAAHEIGHQIHATINHQRGMQPWLDRLIAEAGCPHFNYLRSQGFPDCFFVQVPQEFFASMMNQWFTHSHDVLRLGLHRFEQGNPHPLNQAIFLLAAFGTNHVYERVSRSSVYGAVWAYRYQEGAPRVEVWQVFPWRCPGPIQITGPDFSLGLTTDKACHVMAITHAEGI
jgi:hypothetical protein